MPCVGVGAQVVLNGTGGGFAETFDVRRELPPHVHDLPFDRSILVFEGPAVLVRAPRRRGGGGLEFRARAASLGAEMLAGRPQCAGAGGGLIGVESEPFVTHPDRENHAQSSRGAPRPDAA